jgi:hypothetical protein
MRFKNSIVAGIYVVISGFESVSFDLRDKNMKRNMINDL